MKPLLHPGSTVVRRGTRTFQVGTMPGTVTTLADGPDVLALLRAADGVRDLETIAALLRRTPTDVQGQLDALVSSGVLVDATAWDDAGGDALVAEARALAVAGCPTEEVAARMRARASARVEIASDLLTYDLAARIRRVLADAGVHVTVGPADAPGLVLVVSTGPGPREAFDVLAGAGVAHLPVVREGAYARVGPLVRPGLTPCVRCDDVDRASYDPAWPIVLEQVAHPVAQAPAAHPHAQSVVGAEVVATQVAALVLEFCDGLPTPVDGAVTVLDGRQPMAAPTAVALQAGCPCQLLAATTDSDARVSVGRGVRMSA